jgi:site-specific recombinase XerD
MFANEDRAWVFAQERDLEIRNHGLRYGDIPPEVRRAFDFYRDQQSSLTAMGATVPPFEEMVTACLASIKESYQSAQELQTSTAEAIAEFLRYQSTRVGKLHHSGLKKQLNRFAKVFGDRPISSLGMGELEEWVSGLESRRNPDKITPPPLVSTVTRNAYRTTLHSLFKFAVRRSWRPQNPLAGSGYEKEHRSEPKAYSVESSIAILKAAVDHHPELIPVMALGFFAGLRPCEAEPFDLSKLTPETVEFRVVSTKTGPRIVPFTDACKAWVFSQPRRSGKAWEGESRDKDGLVKELYTIAGVEKIHDGFRHSFISYRCAVIRDVAQVADECGNSPNTIKKNYREHVPAASGEKYFAIRPEAPAENVTDIEEGRASA